MIGHALPNAMVGVWAVVGTLAGAILTSTAVVETVFNLPGLGRLAIEAVLARDYPVAGAVVLVFVLVQVTISLAVDLLIVAIAPTDRDTLDQP
jgi:peptide/nickel transport system permease protein